VFLGIDTESLGVFEHVETIAGANTVEAEGEQRLSVGDLGDDVDPFEYERLSEVGGGRGPMSKDLRSKLPGLPLEDGLSLFLSGGAVHGGRVGDR